MFLLLAACGDDAGALPDGPSPEPACAPTEVIATHAGAIAADETWTSGVHRVTGTVTVGGGTLTIAKCTEVRLAPGASILVSPSATALIAEGDDAHPIRFVRDDAGAAWGRVQATAPARMSLAHATLVGGGTTEELGTMIEARGDRSLPHVLRVDHVTVDGAAGIGVFLNAAKLEAGSQALTIVRSGSHPILLGADTASELPDGSYTGNAHDQILLQSAGGAAAFDQNRPIVADATLHDRGVPYRVGVLPAAIVVGSNVAGDPPAKLTIEAGVQLELVPQTAGTSSRIQVRQPGALVVAGTDAAPVRFASASATPAAGDWQGIEFRGHLDPASRIDHAIIEHAGGASFSRGVCEWRAGSDDASSIAAVIVGVGAGQVPAGEIVTNTRIAHSAGAGIYRLWNAADVDFLATNQFDDVAGCLETNVPDAQNACPQTSCPTL